jgi:rhamnogalacturonyl hydrolase YesR
VAGSGGASGTGGAGGAGGATAACVNASDFATWPTGKGPLDIGRLATTNFKSHTGDAYGGAGYALVFTWFGALRFTKITADTTNNAYLITAFEPYLTGSVAAPDNSATATVDTRAFGDLPLEIYLQNMDARDLTLGLARADMQWATPSAAGITSDARYWADDMFMITGLQVAAYRATKDSKYLNRAASTMLAYFTALQQPGGLFWHTMTSKPYWGRANGWVAAGMTELLLELPAGSVRDSIMAGFKKQMDGLLPLQINGGADDGCWRQVLDLTSAQAETSCTAMFTYALVNAVRNGWLTDPQYAAAARKGWLALGNKTNASGQLAQVCPGTGAAPAGTLAQQQMFYTSITLGSNDMHGQAPLLWVADALLRPDCPGVR